MNENMEDGAARVTARRRLIRGAFGAPAALTLYSGNVFAQASSSLRALNNQLKPGAASFPAPTLPQWPTPSSPETWIRVQVWKPTTAVDPPALYVEGSAVRALRLQYACGYSSFFEAQFINIFDNTGADGAGLESTNNYAALRFDATGFIVGVSTGAIVSGQTALPQSAGTSLGVVGACV